MKDLSSLLRNPLVRRACVSARDLLAALLFIGPLVLCLAARVSAQSTFSMRINGGWNLLSLPASVENRSRAFLFPLSVSYAHFWEDSGYVPADTLHSGLGFWLKFDSSQTVLIEGNTIFGDTIPVLEEWNIIGALSLPIPVSAIQTDPPGIIASPFFNYTGYRYRETDTLQPGLGYWVKVEQPGSMVVASWCPGIPTVAYSGKTYNTVQIGDQCWLRENLDVGTMIPASLFQGDNDTIEKFCYDNNPLNCEIYGGLYEWGEAMQYEITPGVQGICPPGWHMPTIAEFRAESIAVGGDGNSLKAVGQGSGTNTSGFSALLGGRRDAGFLGLGTLTPIWSSTLGDLAVSESCMVLWGPLNRIFLEFQHQQYGSSIRCLRNAASNPPPHGSLHSAPPGASPGPFTRRPGYPRITPRNTPM